MKVFFNIFSMYCWLFVPWTVHLDHRWGQSFIFHRQDSEEEVSTHDGVPQDAAPSGGCLFWYGTQRGLQWEVGGDQQNHQHQNVSVPSVCEDISHSNCAVDIDFVACVLTAGTDDVNHGVEKKETNLCINRKVIGNQDKCSYYLSSVT